MASKLSIPIFTFREIFICIMTLHEHLVSIYETLVYHPLVNAAAKCTVSASMLSKVHQHINFIFTVFFFFFFFFVCCFKFKYIVAFYKHLIWI